MRSTALDPIKSSVSCLSASAWPVLLINSCRDLLSDKATVGNGFLALTSSVGSFSSCLQSFLTSGSFPMSQLFASGGQSIGASALASVLPINIQDWLPLGLTSVISMLSKGLSRVFSSTTIQRRQFFGVQPFFIVQLSRVYMTTGKTKALTLKTFVSKVIMSSLSHFILYGAHVLVFVVWLCCLCCWWAQGCLLCEQWYLLASCTGCCKPVTSVKGGRFIVNALYWGMVASNGLR